MRTLPKSPKAYKHRIKIVTLRGIIIPERWDEEGRVTALALSSRDEKYYLIELGANQHSLYDCLQKEVEVRGVLQGTGEGGKIILQGFRRVSGFPLEPVLQAAGKD